MCVVGGGRFLAQSSALGCGEGMCIESRTAQMIFRRAQRNGVDGF